MYEIKGKQFIIAKPQFFCVVDSIEAGRAYLFNNYDVIDFDVDVDNDAADAAVMIHGQIWTVTIESRA